MMRYIVNCSSDTSHLARLVEDVTRNGLPESANVIYKGRNTVYTVSYGGDMVNVKAFHCPKFFNAYVYTTLRKGKAVRSFLNASRLLEMGFLSPMPIGYGEERQGIKLMHSYYFSRHLPFDNLRDWTKKPDCESLLRAFAKEIVRLHRAGVWHKDFSPGNILYTGSETDGYKFYYIDLNRMEFDVHNRRKLMSMFRAISLDPEETARLARFYAEEAGEDPNAVVAEALEQLDGYFRKRRWKKWLKKIFKRKKK